MREGLPPELRLESPSEDPRGAELRVQRWPRVQGGRAAEASANPPRVRRGSRPHGWQRIPARARSLEGRAGSKEMNSFVMLIYFLFRKVEINLYYHQQFIKYLCFPFCLSSSFTILIDFGWFGLEYLQGI